MRQPDHQDADLLLRLYELRREGELRQARHWYLTSYQPRPWTACKAEYCKGGEEDRFVRMVTSYWDMVGAIVNHGILQADLFFETTSEPTRIWEKARTWIDGARQEICPTYLRNLELLVTRHLTWRKRYATALPHEHSPNP